LGTASLNFLLKIISSGVQVLSALKNKKENVFTFSLSFFVRGRGLEPPCLAALAPKASVSAISPPAQLFFYTVVTNNFSSSLFLPCHHKYFSAEKSRDPASRRRVPARTMQNKIKVIFYVCIVRPLGIEPRTLSLRGV
jgi:hypothetical protein